MEKSKSKGPEIVKGEQKEPGADGSRFQSGPRGDGEANGEDVRGGPRGRRKRPESAAAELLRRHQERHAAAKMGLWGLLARRRAVKIQNLGRLTGGRARPSSTERPRPSPHQTPGLFIPS